jgi:SET domain-containing protein
MLLVPVQADRSPIHGLGLFAIATIPAGTPIWRFQPGFDQIFDLRAFDALPSPAQAHLRHFGFLDGERRHWVLDGDLAIFMNHAVEPNTGAPGTEGVAELTVALRAIAAGEELTCDYRAFDAGGKPLD